ncbi:hypothetical protein NSE_0776 [Neorickettsia sennetsu str. Miyayama]|uniref:Uncharacterized protein n=1 Tax=Ehrlichia sennetsu (strain ATCC VR-367 / Miyayama) TaxID=222891 RepID=Q2GCZ5_EHRS3|nr:hypothetical protein NSE_0776 [Neorickettsia sennetsu str. Miyayama]
MAAQQLGPYKLLLDAFSLGTFRCRGGQCCAGIRSILLISFNGILYESAVHSHNAAGQIT